MRKKIKKKIFISILLIIFALISTTSYFALAESGNTTELETSLENTIFEQISSLDFSNLDNIVENLQEYTPFTSGSFKEKVQEIISGEFSIGYSSVFSAIINLLLKSLLNFIPLFAVIIGIGVLSSFISTLTPNSKNKAIADIVHFVCYSVIIIIVFSAVVQLIKVTGQTLNSLKVQIDLIFPILLTIMTALGSVAAASVYQPAVAIFSGGIVQLFSSVIMPLFIFTLVFSVVGNISSNLQLKKFNEFFNSSFKWIVGTTFTIFMGFMSIQGITAGSYDKVSIRTAKFAMKSYIPILGGYLSDGFNVILASGVLVKNSVGLAGLILMFATILMPIIQMLVLKLGLNLTAAILEPIVDKRISNFIMGVSKTLVMLLCTILAVAFMYFIMVGLIISTANLV
ncbi:MAG: stage III sporulation protein AE [Clostridia bacterium]|nr:stage III sporulation protein AE [Clostridia bacterium]